MPLVTGRSAFQTKRLRRRRPTKTIATMIATLPQCGRTPEAGAERRRLQADQRPEQGQGDQSGDERVLDGIDIAVAALSGRLDRGRLAGQRAGALLVLNFGPFGAKVGSRLGRGRFRPCQTFSTSGRPSSPEGRKIRVMARIEKAATSLYSTEK